jgi:DNA polymerase I-like protein with 3'-5' exonuclease and polymerase domains
MLVTSLEHGKAIVKRFLNYDWTYLDCETTGRSEFVEDKKAALLIGRTAIKVFSICYRGEVYSFPTNYLSFRFPTIFQWFAIFEPLFEKMLIVTHNVNYDFTAFRTEIGVKLIWRKIWCSMIGGWAANPERAKSLKDRSALFGRFVQSTKNINFQNKIELSDYAEGDVIAGDEMYQMQRFGYVERRATIPHLLENGKIRQISNPMPAGRLVVAGESLGPFERRWVNIIELPMLRSTIDAELHGFPYDLPLNKKKRLILEKDKDEGLKELYRLAGEKVNYNSGKQLEALFKKFKIQNPYRTPKGAMAFGEDILNKLVNAHPVVAKIVKLKKIKKLESVYIGESGLEHYVNPRTNCIHASATTVGAVTGRGTSSNPNLQQIPSKNDIYGIKECFIAPKKAKGFRRNQKLICLDYAQLELRIACQYSKDIEMCKILRDPKGDIHTNRFNVDRDPTAKQLNFLLLFGGMQWMLAENLTNEGVPTTPDEAAVYLARYSEVHPGQVAFRKQLLREHEDKGYITYLTGRKRWIEGIDWDNKKDRHKAETTLSNNSIQGVGQDFLKAAVIRCSPKRINPDKAVLNSNIPLRPKFKALLKDYARRVEKQRKVLKDAHTQFLLQVHDEVLFCADEPAAEEVGNIICSTMCWAHPFPVSRHNPNYGYNVPLVADGGIGDNWKQAKGKTPEIKLHSGFEEYAEFEGI